MHKETIAAVDLYYQRLAELNGVPVDRIANGKKFTIAPEVDQAIREKIQQSSDFLRSINLVTVDNQQGEALGLGTTTTIAGRTLTTGAGSAAREPTDPTGFDSDSYNCKQTNYDTALRYATLDSWRHLPNFQTIWSQSIIEQIALDDIMIGFNGTSAAATTDRTANPLLQDVNIGWLQKLRTGNAARWVTRGDAAVGEIRVGTETGFDFRNLDDLAYELQSVLHERFVSDPRMRVFLSRDLVMDKYATFVHTSAADAPTERSAWETLILNKRIGGYPALVPPFFPDRTMLLTMPQNLSIYQQNGTRRRSIQDTPARDQINDFQSVNNAYVVERFEAAAGCENITYHGEETWTG